MRTAAIDYKARVAVSNVAGLVDIAIAILLADAMLKKA
jgi:hypothetical protein